MPTDLRKARELFLHAVGKLPAEQWEGYVSQACGEDTEMAQQVGQLLQVHREAGSFLDAPASGLELLGTNTAMHPRLAEGPGTIIGPYNLLQQIGEGGMGVVFMAEQTEPIQRTVALKIIKPGMDTRRVIARFEAERQALAMMDHPNIAKVLDAGTTDNGRSYFVMELVNGAPITKYCDEKLLSVRARLQLFVAVCQAVQHAHQRGIIHRDIKPTNVLVADYDNQPMPKIIDFGVAKATAQNLTETTMFTEVGQVLGTMEYMSPEQSKFNHFDIDTRSDIYSLGILLYELLTGSTPFERERLRDAAFDEVLRIIREEEPPKPSRRLNSLSIGEKPGPPSLASIAASRHTEPNRLSRDVRGELDWIVMKALEKDRNRRYETASSFAADIERHLHDQLVEAGPPSTAYRFRKFARRNKTALISMIMMALAALVAVGSIGWAVRDRAAREDQLAHERTARQARVSGQVELILDEVAQFEQAEKWSEALASARRAEPALAASEAPPEIQRRTRQTLADLELVQRVNEIRAQSGTVWWWWNTPGPTRDPGILRADQDYAAAFREAGIDADTLPVKESIERINGRRSIAAALLPAIDDWLVVRSVGRDEVATHRLIDILGGADQDTWRKRLREALACKDWAALGKLAKSADLEQQPVATLSFLSGALRANRSYPDTESVLRRAQRKYPADFWINHRLGIDLIWQQGEHVAEGMGFLRAAVAVRPDSAHAIMNLGNGYAFLGQYEEAIQCFRKALELKPDYAVCHGNLGWVLGLSGLYDEAIAALEQSIKVKPTYDSPHAELSIIHSNRPETQLRNPRRATELAEKAVELEPEVSNNWTALGIAHYRETQWPQARIAFDKSLQLNTGSSGGGHQWADAINWFFLAMCNWQLGQKDEARQCFEKGAAWMAMNPGTGNDRHVEQLIRIRAEAVELLNLTDEKATPTRVNVK